MHSLRAHGPFPVRLGCEENASSFSTVDHTGRVPSRYNRPISCIHNNLHLARLSCVCAVGQEGAIILDIEKPEGRGRSRSMMAARSASTPYDVKLAISYRSPIRLLPMAKRHAIVSCSPEISELNDRLQPRASAGN